MVFTATQLTAFFENNPQMALPHDARQRLAQEGLTTIDDFVDFKEEELKQAIKNLRSPIPGIPAVLDAGGNEASTAVPPIPACLVSAKCALRLKVASCAFHYYSSIGREVTSANMNYASVLKDFFTEWEAMQKLAGEDKATVPLITKQLTPLKWLESFRDCLSRTYGVRGCPLSYVTRKSVNVPTEADDPLKRNLAFGEADSVVDELVKRLSHTHPLFKQDNGSACSMLEQAIRGAPHASTIKAHSRSKNGRSA